MVEIKMIGFEKLVAATILKTDSNPMGLEVKKNTVGHKSVFSTTSIFLNDNIVSDSVYYI